MHNVGIYTNTKYTAYMYPNKIIITTKHQSFRIAYESNPGTFLLDSLKLAIINGKIQDVSDVGEYNMGILKWYDCKEPKCAINAEKL